MTDTPQPGSPFTGNEIDALRAYFEAADKERRRCAQVEFWKFVALFAWALFVGAVFAVIVFFWPWPA